MPTTASSTGRPPKELLGISHSVTDQAITKKSPASLLGYSLHLEDWILDSSNFFVLMQVKSQSLTWHHFWKTFTCVKINPQVWLLLQLSIQIRYYVICIINFMYRCIKGNLVWNILLSSVNNDEESFIWFCCSSKILLRVLFLISCLGNQLCY